MQLPTSGHVIANRICFNPHPSRGTGATDFVVQLVVGASVSILTRPEGRVQPHRAIRSARSQQVSILTRPEGRVQLLKEGKRIRVNEVSILTRPEGRVQRPCRSGGWRFHPVSILTRPEGRVQRYQRIISSFGEICFNPHPSRGTGAT